MTPPKILAIGGAHIDRRGQMTGPFVPGASNPGTMREDVGGGAFNALRNAVRRGVDGVADVGARRRCGRRHAWRGRSREAGIRDLSAVFLDRATPSYTALLDRDGDVVAALADMALYEMAFPKQIRRAKVREEIADADAILCDANLPAAGAAAAGGACRRQAGLRHRHLAGQGGAAGGRAARARLPVHEPPRGGRARRHGAATRRRGDRRAGCATLGLARGVITQGSEAVIGFDARGVFSIMPPAPRKIADVTGAGDALAGATTVALLRGLPFGEALREGMAAALLAIESPTAVPEFPQSALRRGAGPCAAGRGNAMRPQSGDAMTPETARPFVDILRAGRRGARRRPAGRGAGKHDHHPWHALSRKTARWRPMSSRSSPDEGAVPATIAVIDGRHEDRPVDGRARGAGARLTAR